MKRIARAIGLKPLTNDHGIAMAGVLMLLLLTCTLGAGTMLYTMLDAKSTAHYATGNQAFAAAEGGVLDALNGINSVGILNFKTEVVDTNVLVNKSLVTLAPNITYQVSATAVNLPTGACCDPNRGILTVVGKAALSAERQITLNVNRAQFLLGPGAIHLTNDSTSTAGNATGASLMLDGNNWKATVNADGSVTKTLDPSVNSRPGISTRNDTVKDYLKTNIGYSTQQYITGLEYGVDTSHPASITSTGSASTSQMQSIAQQIIAAASATGGGDYKTYNGTVSGKKDLGSPTNPQVTVLNGNAAVSGGMEGYGILIVNGPTLRLNGAFNFYGWILFNTDQPTSVVVNGNAGDKAAIFGMLWTSALNFTSNGAVNVQYCDNCLRQWADKAGRQQSNLPAPVSVSSWG